MFSLIHTILEDLTHHCISAFEVFLFWKTHQHHISRYEMRKTAFSTWDTDTTMQTRRRKSFQCKTFSHDLMPLTEARRDESGIGRIRCSLYLSGFGAFFALEILHFWKIDNPFPWSEGRGKKGENKKLHIGYIENLPASSH